MAFSKVAGDSDLVIFRGSGVLCVAQTSFNNFKDKFSLRAFGWENFEPRKCVNLCRWLIMLGIGLIA